MKPSINYRQIGICRRLGRTGLIIATVLLISSAPIQILAEDAVSSCLQIAAHKLRVGKRIVVTEVGGMITRGGFVSVDTAAGLLTIHELSDEKAEVSRMSFNESQIARIEIERRWKPVYLLAGSILGGVVGAILANSIDDDDGDSGFDPLGKKIVAFEASLIGGAAIGLILSITQGGRQAIECPQKKP